MPDYREPDREDRFDFDDDDRGPRRRRARDDDEDDDDDDDYPRRPDIPNYLVQSILCTVFCCMPFGIVGIVYAASVNSKTASRDYRGAKQASESAKMWCWVSFGSHLALIVIYLVVLFAIGFGAAARNNN